MADIISSITGGFGDPINMAINLILSTIVMGIVIIILTKIIARSADEEVALSHAFMLALVLNIINVPIFFGLIYGFVVFIPFIDIVLPLLIWIIGTKLFFTNLRIVHALIIGLVGYALSIFVIPIIVTLLFGFIPL